MKKIKSLTEKTPLLPQAEWDFSKVREAESSLCLYHEYGRNAGAFRVRVQKWRKRHPEIFAAACKLICLVNHHQREQGADKFRRAWKSFLDLSLTSSSDVTYPDGLSRTDPLSTLYLFPPFPEQRWLEIDEPIRKAGFFLLGPDTALRAFQPPQKSAARTTLDRQRQVQDLAKAPMDEQQLAQAARYQINQHVFAPPLIEGSGFGMLPVSVQLDKNGDQAFAEGKCRERVTFIINWARSDDEIRNAFKKWLIQPKRRPHKRFEHWKMTTALEHLKKLGAFRILDSGASAFQAADNYPLYPNPEQYRKAKREAQQLILELFPPQNT